MSLKRFLKTDKSDLRWGRWTCYRKRAAASLGAVIANRRKWTLTHDDSAWPYYIQTSSLYLLFIYYLFIFIYWWQQSFSKQNRNVPNWTTACSLAL